MAKEEYTIETITKKQCEPLLRDHHYLTAISRGFKSGKNYGLVYCGKVVGVCIFTGLPTPELAKGMFGLDRDDQHGLYELSRLVLHPENQEKEHNLAGWFVARCIKHLRKATNVRAILSYADNDFHSGTVYRALGFEYFGLSQRKKDFWILQSDGSYQKHNRGSVRHLEGEWRDRTQKHRFLKVFDKTLNAKWRVQ